MTHTMSVDPIVTDLPASNAAMAPAPNIGASLPVSDGTIGP